MNSKARVLFFKIPDTLDVLNWLSQETQISTSRLQELIQIGCLYINKKRVLLLEEATYQVGDIIRLHIEPKLFDSQLLSQIEIINETSDWILVFKPAGLPTHETLDNIHQNVKAELQKIISNVLYPLFRLDVGTQGLLLMAKNKDYARFFNQLQLEQQVTKGYWAFTRLPSQPFFPIFWIDYMKKSDRAPRELINISDFELLNTSNQKQYQRCELQILNQQSEGLIAHWDLVLKTGRTHQIRCQMKLRDLPLLGDQLYGGERSLCPSHEVLGLICHHLSWPSHGQSPRNEFRLSRQRIPKLLSCFS